MNLQDLRYFVAVAEFGHFGHAAKSCHVSQPTLSGQLKKLEEDLGVTLFERTNKKVSLTPIGKKLLVHARSALQQAKLVEAVAKTSQNPLVGPLKLGVIPTLAPYLMPRILPLLRKAYPAMTIELWEDLTQSLVSMLSGQRLDAALVATELSKADDLTSIPLFAEPFLAALPAKHRLAGKNAVNVHDLAGELLVLADGHCLADQAIAVCGRKASARGPYQAASLDTLISLVEAGYGTTLIPAHAIASLDRRGIVFRPLQQRVTRTIRLASRGTFPRPEALRALEKVIRQAISS